jgi:hypothetical protein
VDWEFWRKTFRRIESVFGKPQDIEWGVAENGDAVILQARPITTLPDSDIRLLREFDRFESARPFGKERYRLVRNELCEPFDEPTDAELAFLRRLYRHSAVARAYASYGIRYVPRDFLVTVAKKLFIDEAEERRCFEGDVSDSKIANLWTRWKNLWRLGAVGAQVAHGGRKRLERLESDMLSAVEFAVSMRESGERIEESDLLDRLYAPVFETNFLAASLQAFRRGRPSPVGAPYVPSNPERWKGLFLRTDSLGLLGNSLAWSDMSAFSTPFSKKDRFDLSGSEFSPEAALDFLREAGRTVSVICANVLRGSEKTSGNLVPARSPKKLASPFFEWKKSSRIEWEELSSGSAEGEFFLWDGKNPLPSRPLVVFVETLDPSLVDVLTDSVQAVVSRR